MPFGRTDWVDRVARRAVRGRPWRAPEHTRDREIATSVEDQFSRKSALKLAAVGAGSVLLGLWRVPSARALNRGQCVELCLDAYEALLKQRLQACNDVLLPSELENTNTGFWETVMPFPALTGFKVGVLVSLTGLCYAKAKRDVLNTRNECIETCQHTCPPAVPGLAEGRRALTATIMCKYRPPKKPKPPSVPPLPSPQDAGPCWGCAQVSPPAYCSECPSVAGGYMCCALPPKNGKSPCCP
jgi:hypothetical protein